MEKKNQLAKQWWDEALHRHYEKNPHHIQYFHIHQLDATRLPEIVQREMVVDMLSCCMIPKHKAGREQDWTVSELAYQCRQWPNWIHAAPAYTGTYDEPPKDRPNPQRWAFTESERVLFDGEIDTLFDLTAYFYEDHRDEKLELFYQLASVQAYLKDLKIHRYYVEKFARQLYPNDSRLHEVCENHDADKLLPFMIGAYTLRFVSNLG